MKTTIARTRGVLGVIAVFLVATVVLSSSLLTGVATALSIDSATPNKGSVNGGELVTLKGSFVDRVKIKDIVYGYDVGLILSEDGKLYSWGRNDFGQLGNGTNTNSTELTEVDMTGALVGKTISQISMGAHTTLVLTTDNKLYSWGYNLYGQLGNGTYPTNSNVPVEVNMIALAGKTVSKIAAGFSGSLVLTTDNLLYSWGWNHIGQTGQNTITAAPITTPAPVYMSGDLLGSTIKDIKAGSSFFFVSNTSNELFSWGYNGNGALGIGTFSDSSSAKKMNMSFLGSASLDSFEVMKEYGGILTDSDGNVYTWGHNLYGQLGDGTSSNSNVPIKIMDSSVYGVPVHVYSGIYNVAVVYSNNTYVWGRAHYGQLGDGEDSVPYRNTPQLLTTSVYTDQRIMFGYRNVFFVNDNEIYGIGHNASGQLGDGSVSDSVEPKKLLGLVISEPSEIVFGDKVVSDFTLIDDRTIQLAAPANTKGYVDIAIGDTYGNSFTLTNGYEYIDYGLIGVPNTGA